MRHWTIAAVAGCGLAACVFTRVNPDHCANNGGDAHCAQIDGDAPYCALDHCGVYDASTNPHGCVAEQPAPQCASPCGVGGGNGCVEPNGESSSGEDSSGSGGSSSTGSDTSSTGSTGSPECASDDMCPSDRPFCSNGGCVTCGGSLLPDTACAALSTEQPYCVDDRCVQCRADEDCGDDAPLCNVTLGICASCSYHEQCASGACHIAEGTCIPAFDVRYVDADLDGSGGGTADDPYHTIETGITGIGQGTVRALVLLEADRPYDVAHVTGNKSVAIIGAEGSQAEINVDTYLGLVRATENAKVYLANVAIRGNLEGPGIETRTGARVWLDRVKVVQNNGGLDLQQSELHVRNSVIGNNGSGSAQIGGLVAAASTFDIVYSTIASNDAMLAGHSIRCDAESSGTIRNSIVVATEDSVDCASLVADESVVDAEGLDGDYVVVPAVDFDWFVNANLADFHLTGAASMFSEVAVWREGDPSIDLDADARPDVDGTREYPGADRPR